MEEASGLFREGEAPVNKYGGDGAVTFQGTYQERYLFCVRGMDLPGFLHVIAV
jgi:hypothetical protein